MKNFKRILLTVVAAMLLMAVTVAGTLAYLQAETGTVTNTFESGNVSFDEDMNGGLDEGDVWEPGDKYTTGENAGKPVSAEDLGQHTDDGETRVTENRYKLVPGKTYDKDPIVYIAAGSEPCYVFVEVTNEMKAYLTADCIENQMKAKNWVQLSGDIWYYDGIVDALNITEDNIPLPVFETITLLDTLNETQLAEASAKKIVIKAYAVQELGFADQADAWSKTFGAPAQDETTGE